MAVNRYWRISYQAVLIGSQTGLNKIEMRETVGGANEATNPAAAFASGTYGGVYAPSSAFDNDPNKDWFAPGGYGVNGNWIAYDFGAGNEKNIHEIVLTASNTSPEGAPCLFFVESSGDALIWGFEWMGYYQPNWGALVQQAFAKPIKRVDNEQWGMFTSNTQNNNLDMLVSEVHFRDTVGGPSIIPASADYRPSDNPAIYDIANAYDNNVNTDIYSGRAGLASFVRYGYATPQTMVELAVTSGEANNGNNERAPTVGFIMFGQDGLSWLIGGAVGATTWNVHEEKVFDVSIVPTVLRSEQARNLAVYQIPTVEMRATGALEMIPYQRQTIMEATQAFAMAVCKGRVANPRLRIWTFTLDTHDFIILRLGDNETIVYDTVSEQWVDWDSNGSFAWRANTGITWIGGQALGNVYGSNVVVGDDTFGLLWLLDPKQAWDDAPVADYPAQQVPIKRVLTGQVLAKNRQFLPCYSVFVDGDNFGLVATDFVPGITLEYSDDQGRTFTSAGTLTVAVDMPGDSYLWGSIGQISSPGRIFRITDNGVFARVDAMGMNENGE